MHQCGGRKEREIDYEVEIIIYVQSELGTMHSHSHEKENPSRENQFFDRDLLRNRGPTSDFVVAIFAIVSRFGRKVALFILIAELCCLC